MSKTKKNARSPRVARKAETVTEKVAQAGKGKNPAKAVTSKPEKKACANSKQAALITLLERPSGATIEEMVKATGWQQHSVRGVISGVLKKRLGLSIASDKDGERGRIYRIAGSRA